MLTQEIVDMTVLSMSLGDLKPDHGPVIINGEEYLLFNDVGGVKGVSMLPRGIYHTANPRDLSNWIEPTEKVEGFVNYRALFYTSIARIVEVVLESVCYSVPKYLTVEEAIKQGELYVCNAPAFDSVNIREINGWIKEKDYNEFIKRKQEKLAMKSLAQEKIDKAMTDWMENKIMPDYVAKQSNNSHVFIFNNLGALVTNFSSAYPQKLFDINNWKPLGSKIEGFVNYTTTQLKDDKTKRTTLYIAGNFYIIPGGVSVAEYLRDCEIIKGFVDEHNVPNDGRFEQNHGWVTVKEFEAFKERLVKKENDAKRHLKETHLFGYGCCLNIVGDVEIKGDINLALSLEPLELSHVHPTRIYAKGKTAEKTLTTPPSGDYKQECSCQLCDLKDQIDALKNITTSSNTLNNIIPVTLNNVLRGIEKMKSKQRNEQPTGRLKSLQEIQITPPTSHYGVLKNPGHERILMTSFVHSGLRNKPLLEKTKGSRPRYTLSWINGSLIIRDTHVHGTLEIIPGKGVNLNTILDTLNQLRGLMLHGENQLFIDNPGFSVHKQTTLRLNNVVVKDYSHKPLYLEGCLDLNNISIRTESLVNFCNMFNKN